MTWIDNTGEIRPQSWEEYCEMQEYVPAWALPLQSVYQPLHRQQPRKRNDGKGVSRMRQRLFRADPHCFWCGVEVALDTKNLSALATVDHLYSCWHPERKSRHVEGQGVLQVLTCHSCNQERAGAGVQSQPFIPKLRERLEFAQQADATLARNNKTAAESRGNERVHRSATTTAPIAKRPCPTTTRTICTLKEAIEFARENPAR